MHPRALLFFGLVLPATAVLTAGCGDSPAAPVPEPTVPTLIRASEPDASDVPNASNETGGASTAPGVNQLDAAASPPAALTVVRGNALCHAQLSGCYPDAVIDACNLELDGGASGADANSDFAPGCHAPTDGSQTVCLPGGGGMKNSTCAGPTECAAGHECVGSGVCQKYCCSGDTECALNEFCDIQPMVQSPETLVPVCATMVPCVLLDSDGCPANQQCGVVRENGSTSCVALGTAAEGDPCEDAHCGHGLVCLGAQGARRCAKLCYKGILGQCKTHQNCEGALPLFLTPTVGVCQ